MLMQIWLLHFPQSMRFTTVDTNVADVDSDLVAALAAINARFTTVDNKRFRC